MLTKVYGWFYWVINLGAAAAFFIIPWIHLQAGYRWAFGVPGIAMGLATLIFWLGTKHYVAPARRALGGPDAVFSGHRARPDASIGKKARRKVFGRRLERFFARGSRGCPDGRRHLVISATVPMFWALFNQVNSTWVLQGKNMRPFYLLNGETMQGAGAVLVMIWVPILTLGVYPRLERLGLRPTALRRMSAGMVLGAAAFFICGLMQARLDRGESLSIVWQLVPYVVLEAGEVLLSATALEFAFQQAPKQLKSMIMSFWLMTIAGGHFLIAVITGLNSRFVHAQGAAEFFFYAILMLVVAGAFIFCASRYRERPPVGS